MALWFWGVIFFAVTFVPRFFTLMNFGYGYADLGLYSQMMASLAHFQFNPVLLSYGRPYLQIKPQPWIYFFLPLSFVTSNAAALILFIDEIAVFITASLCARFAWKKLKSRPLEVGICLAVLFSALTMNSLHAPTRVTVWAQVPLTLLMIEYFSHRRPVPLAIWFTVLCFLDMRLGILAGIFVPLILVTQRKRWNGQRRLLAALPVLMIGALSLACLHACGGKASLDTELFFQVQGPVLITWLVSFWLLPLLNLEIILIAVFLMMLNLDGVHDPSLLVPLGALGVVKSLEWLNLKDTWVKNLVGAGLVATAVYYNFLGSDPFFTPWKPEHHSLLASSRILHDLTAHVPPDASVLVSDELSPSMAGNISMGVLDAQTVRTVVPDYVISVNQPTPFDHDPRFKLSENYSDLGARLLTRIK